MGKPSFNFGSSRIAGAKFGRSMLEPFWMPPGLVTSRSLQYLCLSLSDVWWPKPESNKGSAGDGRIVLTCVDLSR